MNRSAGRPTGATNAASLETNKRKESTLLLLTQKVKETKMNNVNSCLPRGAYKQYG